MRKRIGASRLPPMECRQFCFLVAVVLTIGLMFVSPAHAQNLATLLVPKGWPAISQPLDHPAVLQARQHPDNSYIRWNLTQSKGNSFPPPTRYERKRMVRMDFEKMGVTPDKTILLTNKPQLFTVLVEYSQKGISFVSGILVLHDREKARTLFSTFLGPLKTSPKIQKLVEDQADTLLSILPELQPEPPPAANNKKKSSEFLIGLFVSLITILIILFGVFGWKLLKPR